MELAKKAGSFFVRKPCIKKNNAHKALRENICNKNTLTGGLYMPKTKIKTDVSINTSLDNITDFSLISDKICYRLVNKKSNNQLLAAIPHRDFFDMAIIYHINLSPSDEDAYTISITNNMLKNWGVGEEKLYELAHINTPQLERGYIAPSIPLQDDNNRECIVCKNFDLVLAGADDHTPMYSATTNRTDNAAVILYDGLLKEVSKFLGSFFVTPLSEYRCSITPGTRADSEKMLKITRTINETVICKEDMLSENCFYYDAENHKLELIE